MFKRRKYLRNLIRLASNSQSHLVNPSRNYKNVTLFSFDFVAYLTKMSASNGVDNIKIVLTQAKFAKIINHCLVYKMRIREEINYTIVY